MFPSLGSLAPPDDKFLFFPAWICAYICMSAPLGRIVDRHIKLIRYRNHPVVLANEKLSELFSILLSATMVQNRSRPHSEETGLGRTVQRSKQSLRTQKEPKKQESTETCPECMSDDVHRKGQETCAATFATTNGRETMVRITISGHPGSGTSTLVNLLRENKNWTSLNGGELFRQAKRRNMSLADFGQLCKTIST